MAEPLGVASVSVQADLDPLNRDLAKARGQVDQFASTASQSMDKFGQSTSRASKEQEGFNQTLAKSNVIYVDFNKNTRDQAAAVGELNSKMTVAQTQSSSFADKLRDLSTEGHTITEVLKVAGVGALLLSDRFRQVALSAAGTAAKIGAQTGIAAIPTAVTVATGAVGVLGRAFTSLLPLLGPIGLAFTAIKLTLDGVATGIEKVTELSALYDKSLKAGVDAEYFQKQTKAAEDLRLEVDSLTKGTATFTNTFLKPTASGNQLDKTISDLKDLLDLSKNAGTKELNTAATTPEQIAAVNKMITEMINNGQRVAGLELAGKIWPAEVVNNLARSSDYLLQINESIDKAAKSDIVNNQTVMQAKELQTRLAAAYQSLNTTFIDLTSLGLSLRSIWVVIVEVIAAAVTAVGNMITGVGTLLQDVAKAGTEAGKRPGATFQPSVEGYIDPNLGSRGDKTGAITGQRAGSYDYYQQFRDVARANMSPYTPADQNPQMIQQQNEAARTSAKVWGDASTAIKDYKTNMDKLNDLMPSSVDKTKDLNKQLDSAKDAYDNIVKSIKAQAGPGKANQEQLDAAADTYKRVTDGIRKAAAENDAFNRAVQNVSKGIATQEALGKAFNDGAGAIAKARVEAQLTEVALSQGLNPAAGKVADTIKKLSDRAAEAANNLGLMKLKADAAFDLQQLGRTDAEAAVAAKLRPVVGAENVNAQMQTALGQQLMMIENLKVAKDITTNFATTFTSTFVSAIGQGAKAFDAFKQAGQSALQSLSNKLITMATDQLVAKAFGAGTSGGGGGLAGLLGSLFGASGGGFDPTHGVGGPGWTAPITQAYGGVWDHGIQRMSMGGVLNGPTLFRAKNGLVEAGEAGAEAIMPLTRGPGGKLGVAMPDGVGGGGNQQVTNVYLTENYDFRNAENGVEQKVKAVMPKFQKETVAAAVRAVQTGNRNTPAYFSK